MTGGSVQLRDYRIARKAGIPTDIAAQTAGIGIAEARLIDADDAKHPPAPDCYQPLILAPVGHDSGETTVTEESTSGEMLRLFMEHIERLLEEKKGISDDVRDVFSEAKSQGFDIKTMRECLKLRKMDRASRQEREALLQTYGVQLGLF